MVRFGNKTFLHLLLLTESIFLYIAVSKLRSTAKICQTLPQNNKNPPIPPPLTDAAHVSANEDQSLPMIYVVTPTYTRPTQLPDLTRLANTLRLVPRVHWLVCEDAAQPTQAVRDLVAASGLRHTHLAALRPPELVGKVIGRGVFNRRAGLDWIREHATDGVLYFADDDNTYDVRIFEEIRYTKKVSVFPVGVVLKYGVSSPILRNGKVVGFFDAFQAGRKFAMDMAGFATSVQLFRSRPKATIPTRVSFLEEGFVTSLGVTRGELEPKAESCTRVWVWHTRTERGAIPKMDDIQGHSWDDTNLPELYRRLYARKVTETKQ